MLHLFSRRRQELSEGHVMSSVPHRQTEEIGWDWEGLDVATGC